MTDADKDSVNLLKSGKGKIQLIHNGYVLCLNKKPSGKNITSYFRCVSGRGKSKCTATAATAGELEEGKFVLKFHNIHLHDHPPDDTSCKIRINLSKFRETAQKDVDRPVQKIFEEQRISTISQLPSPEKETILSQMPNAKQVLMQGYRARQKNVPPLPKSIHEVDVKGVMATTLDGKNFYRGATEKHTHLFMSGTQCEIASNGSKLFIDGAFSSVPDPFHQVLITRTKIDGKAYTTSYSLLINKQTQSYEFALQHIKDTCNGEGFPLNYIFVHVDCEFALFNAVKKIFPGILVRLCYFHVVDKLRKHKSECGLIPLCRKSDSLKKFYSRCHQLFWIPVALIPRTWRIMKESLDADLLSNEKVLNFILYMERTWVSSSRSNAPLFNPKMTNQFEYDDDDTNNNTSESYNSRMKKRLGTHPNFYKFVHGIRQEAELVHQNFRGLDFNSGSTTRLADKQKYAERQQWKNEFAAAMRSGISNDEIMFFLDQMIEINQIKSHKKKFTQNFTQKQKKPDTLAQNSSSSSSSSSSSLSSSLSSSSESECDSPIRPLTQSIITNSPQTSPENVNSEVFNEKTFSPPWHCSENSTPIYNESEDGPSDHQILNSDLDVTNCIDDLVSEVEKEYTLENYCKICDKTFARADGLQRHQKNIHKKIPSEKAAESPYQPPRTRRQATTLHAPTVEKQKVSSVSEPRRQLRHRISRVQGKKDVMKGKAKKNPEIGWRTPLLRQTPDVIQLQQELRQKLRNDAAIKKKERQNQLAKKNEECRLHNEIVEKKKNDKRKRDEAALEGLIEKRKKRKI